MTDDWAGLGPAGESDLADVGGTWPVPDPEKRTLFVRQYPAMLCRFTGAGLRIPGIPGRAARDFETLPPGRSP